MTRLLGGGPYLAAYQAMRERTVWRALGAFGALAIISFAVPMLPVLFVRAALVFRLPAMIYLAVSLFILLRTAVAA